MTKAGSYLFASQWAGRGWKFLEHYLTRRQLIFSNQQFNWNCNQHLLSESSQVPQKRLWRIPEWDAGLQSVELASSDCSPWHRLIEYYTDTAVFSLHSDKLKVCLNVRLCQDIRAAHPDHNRPHLHRREQVRRGSSARRGRGFGVVGFWGVVYLSCYIKSLKTLRLRPFPDKASVYRPLSHVMQ